MEGAEIYFFDLYLGFHPVGGWGVRLLIMDEDHTSRYSVHQGAMSIVVLRLKRTSETSRDFFNNRILSGKGKDLYNGLCHKVALKVADYRRRKKLARFITNEIVAETWCAGYQSFQTVMVDSRSHLWQVFMEAVGSRTRHEYGLYHTQTDGQSVNLLNSVVGEQSVTKGISIGREWCDLVLKKEKLSTTNVGPFESSSGVGTGGLAGAEFTSHKIKLGNDDDHFPDEIFNLFSEKPVPSSNVSNLSLEDKDH
ncbi:hypothetical protein Tco_0704076 [Tanacetum coccineum]|uniref:Uncharacterized protein n=1 Tax=Tanacetum coccineum TaxID=301880 RepID=A0ABQ4Y0M5_9ASTR